MHGKKAGRPSTDTKANNFELSHDMDLIDRGVSINEVAYHLQQSLVFKNVVLGNFVLAYEIFFFHENFK